MKPGTDDLHTGSPQTLRFFARTNVVVGLSCLALGITLVITGFGYGLLRVSGQPGPGLFPAILGVALALTSLIWLLDGKQRSLASADEEITIPDRHGLISIIVTVRSGFGFILLLQPAGYQVSMTLLVGLLLKVVSRRGWVMTIIVSVVFGLGSYTIFVALLGVPLPLAGIPFLARLGL